MGRLAPQVRRDHRVILVGHLDLRARLGMMGRKGRQARRER